MTDKKLDATVSSKLYTQDGELFEDLGAEKREKISANELPKTLEDAIVSVEDRRFYKHIGVDPIRIIGSALSNFTSGGLQGGSTFDTAIDQTFLLLHQCRGSDSETQGPRSVDGCKIEQKNRNKRS